MIYAQTRHKENSHSLFCLLSGDLSAIEVGISLAVFRIFVIWVSAAT